MKKIDKTLKRTMRKYENYQMLKNGITSRCLYCLEPSIFHIEFCDDLCRELYEDSICYKNVEKNKQNKK